jgi:hypothetical protein
MENAKAAKYNVVDIAIDKGSKSRVAFRVILN